MTKQLAIVIICAAIAVGGLASSLVANSVAAGDSKAKSAAHDKRTHEADRDAVLKDVYAEERHLASFKRDYGTSAVPVQSKEIEVPTGVKKITGNDLDDNIIFGTSVVGDFHDLFVDEGVAMTGVSAKDVDELPNRPTDQLPPRPQAPTKPKPGYRLIKVTLHVINRSGDAIDPACGMDNDFSAYAWDDFANRGGFYSPSYDNVGTYATSCNDGIADGASGDVVLGVGIKKGRKLTSLMFEFLNDKFKSSTGGDGATQVMVFHKPV